MPASGNVGVAFALVAGAGLSTTLGASAAFWARLASTKTLAVGLALSAGVMLYVSFVEIFMTKGVQALEDGGWGADGSYRYGTMLFFGGMLVTAALEVAVHFACNLAGKNLDMDPGSLREVPLKTPSDSGKMPTTGGGADIESQGMDTTKLSFSSGMAGSDTIAGGHGDVAACVQGSHEIEDAPVHLAHKPADMPEDTAAAVDACVTNDHHRFGLQRMGLLTAIAIGIHNLPEGLATFVAALSDPLNGVAIAIAIALHNIPEGVCVAMPVYYATGSRWKGFMWAFLSGISELVGGLLGYLILYGGRMSDIAYGIVFCIVAGMMTFISIKELIPTALKYDPHNKVTSSCVVVGMVVMAVSLLLFTI